MDLEHLELIKNVAFGSEREIYQVLMTEDDNYLFFSDRLYGEVLILDTRINSFTDTLQFNAIPQGLAVVNKRLAPTGIELSQERVTPEAYPFSRGQDNGE